MSAGRFRESVACEELEERVWFTVRGLGVVLNNCCVFVEYFSVPLRRLQCLGQGERLFKGKVGVRLGKEPAPNALVVYTVDVSVSQHFR